MLLTGIWTFLRFLAITALWYALFMAFLKITFCGLYHFTIRKTEWDGTPRPDHDIDHETAHLWENWWTRYVRPGISQLIIFGFVFLWTMLFRWASSTGGDVRWIIYLLPFAAVAHKDIFGPERLWYFDPKKKQDHVTDAWHHDNKWNWIVYSTILIILWWVACYFLNIIPASIGYYLG